MKLIFNWALAAVGVAIAAYLLPGVGVDGVVAALVAAIVLGGINILIRPIILVLTLPINILTLGLFTLVINALLVMFAGAIVPGFSVDGFISALLFSLILTLINFALSRFSQES